MTYEDICVKYYTSQSKMQTRLEPAHERRKREAENEASGGGGGSGSLIWLRGFSKPVKCNHGLYSVTIHVSVMPGELTVAAIVIITPLSSSLK
ncbi:hypothetical protein HDU76_013390 [Blyttiomyces sp. JEL0837]|nr:hypothetical protein HDU76_013390 [Blyttiomyces sp. JEL0837]